MKKLLKVFFLNDFKINRMFGLVHYKKINSSGFHKNYPTLNKVSALTETGKEAMPNPNIWTETYLDALQANEWTKQISYMLTWRNANFERENRDHYYAPFRYVLPKLRSVYHE